MKSKPLEIEAKLYEDDLHKDPRYKDIEYLVEATDNETIPIWQDWQYDADSQGYLISVGELGGRPVNVSLNWATLNGKRFAFWHATSQVADYALIEKWFKKYTSTKAGQPPKTCDARNFHNCAMDLFRDNPVGMRERRKLCVKEQLHNLTNLELNL